MGSKKGESAEAGSGTKAGATKAPRGKARTSRKAAPAAK